MLEVGLVSPRRQVFWILILAVIAVDLWWSSTPGLFAVWWIPVILLNLACLAVILYPIIRGTR